MESPDLKLLYEKMYLKIEHFRPLESCIVGFFCSPMVSLFIYKLFIHLTRGLEIDDYRLLFPIW